MQPTNSIELQSGNYEGNKISYDHTYVRIDTARDYMKFNSIDEAIEQLTEFLVAAKQIKRQAEEQK